MAKSFQHEVPKARVNITLDVETGGAKKKLELPLKLLVMGDYSNGKSSGRIAERERVQIDRNNLESVLEDLSPSISYTVDNKLRDDDSEIKVDLKFDSFKSFHPEQVAKQVPALNNMLAMRNLLTDLKSNLLDNGKFRRELERVLQSQPELEGLMAELKELAPMTEDATAQPESNGEGDGDKA
ncbi:type VI secretion system-associated protein [Alkalilimnicola ehrlichii]|uniref:Type VI secretion system-associated protein n=1 Tax=Alkalilimnicola ehrlichii TaxID=351052 RepID=A0A3E0WTY7_9GAMM|nr:type VI secretion system contractile sheath small subunit [Alkalilimnicola ehrlichii]RFA29852.1 type VI secretion system-associated protein [Alkalilimnicola ehrlichii]RFA36440.1 type VI secretion system-associated protein [Alkalilimnicola ehrlichii]